EAPIDPPVPAPAPKPPLVFEPARADVPGCGVEAAADQVAWCLRTRPPRVQVLYKNERKGETPLVVKVPTDADRAESVTFRLFDHVDETVELHADSDQDELITMQQNVKITLYSKPAGPVIYNERGEGFGVTP